MSKYQRDFERYLELTNQLWNDPQSISPQDEHFLRSFTQAAVASLGPEKLSQEILKYAMPTETSSLEYPRRVAASPLEEESLYFQVLQLAKNCGAQKEIFYEIPVAAGRNIPLLRILPQEAVVQPIYHRDWAVFLEYPGKKPFAVGPYNAEFLTFPQIEHARVVVESEQIRILL